LSGLEDFKEKLCLCEMLRESIVKSSC